MIDRQMRTWVAPTERSLPLYLALCLCGLLCFPLLAALVLPALLEASTDGSSLHRAVGLVGTEYTSLPSNIKISPGLEPKRSHYEIDESWAAGPGPGPG